MPQAQHSTAQSVLHKAANQARADQSVAAQASRQSWREPACRRAFHSNIFLKSPLFFIFLLSFGGAFLYRYNSSSMYERDREHRTARHSTAQRNHAGTKQQTKHVPIRARQHKQANRVGEGQHVVEHLCSSEAFSKRTY